MHILAKNSNGGLMHILRRIYDQFSKRGVNCLENDSLGNNALHYSVESKCYDLCAILIAEKININAANNEGQSPLSILMKGEVGAKLVLQPDLTQPQLG
jgi:ankyrin repeat protein